MRCVAWGLPQVRAGARRIISRPQGLSVSREAVLCSSMRLCCGSSAKVLHQQGARASQRIAAQASQSETAHPDAGADGIVFGKPMAPKELYEAIASRARGCCKVLGAGRFWVMLTHLTVTYLYVRISARGRYAPYCCDRSGALMRLHCLWNCWQQTVLGLCLSNRPRPLHDDAGAELVAEIAGLLQQADASGRGSHSSSGNQVCHAII
jgi:hypothetical protein